MQKPQTRLVFSGNLASLMANEVSISELSRNLSINRTQLHRFLSGESFPRPDVLERICEHFQTDARILTVPLAELQRPNQNAENNILPELNACFRPAPTAMFPDGQYEEWRKLPDKGDRYERQLLRIWTKDNIRRSQSVVRQTCTSDANPVTRQTYIGQAIMQAGGIAILDRTPRNFGIRYRRFKFGYQLDERYFPGWDASTSSTELHFTSPKTIVLLRKVDLSRTQLRNMALEGSIVDESATPPRVKTILHEIQTG